ncbi:high affinity cAMP-specific and IBMX-insensitive 3',5'-cyclic phosphodiesterase 8B-like isoform X2 [Liolophura sinensis]|uniref:high affinity cAMP-specific and IBMX-insensitive 3',5'-cyclic phosphodiesterase 8B-like isoform X2 n=1 Tax=Liolophura sinensis TaxID=3198878 RepID=UPI003158F595
MYQAYRWGLSPNCTAHTGASDRKPSQMEGQGTENDVIFGPMRLKQQTMSILLVFGKEDAQSDGFWWAAGRLGYCCNIARNPESALECYLDKHHDVVILDHRHTKIFDAEALCRSIRATKASDHTTVVAVTKKYQSEKEEPSVLPLINAGINRRYTENANVGACMNELLFIEHGEARSQLKLQACSALFTALEHTSDSVEITNEDHEIQYINPAHERLLGYRADEILGKDAQDFSQSDKNKPDLQETINGQLRKGKVWSGLCYVRRKSGECLQQHCHISPVICQNNKLRHYVSVRCSPSEVPHHLDRIKDLELNLMANGGIHCPPKRRESVARIHSMTIEAPITKVINIINAAQENSPITVVQALDKVLDILRTSELYSPYFTQQMKDEDQMTSDLVGGLMSQGLNRRFSANDVSITKPHHHIHAHIPTPTAALAQVPQNIAAILETENTWDFNVIDLELASNSRPLVYLGMKIFTRFGVCEYLDVSETCLRNWLQLIEANYHACNSYHNSTHASDVLQATAYFLDRDRTKNIFDQLDEVACLIAAVVHDVDHPGKTNAFLVNERNPLAILYNDLAVLESHHAAFAVQLTAKDDLVNIFKNLDSEDFRCVRSMIIDMVLATDMAKHFEHVSKFVNGINKAVLRVDTESNGSGNASPDSSAAVTQLSTAENRTLVKRMLIKCADVSNTVRPFHLCKEWANRIAEEYFNQTAEEIERGLPVVMPTFDRKTCSIPKSQTSFIDYFITDMFDAWDYFCEIPELITHLQNNYKSWKELEEEQNVKDKDEEKT